MPKIYKDLADHVRGVVKQEGECWVFSGTPLANGYAYMLHGGKLDTIQRHSYRAFIGEIPQGLWVIRECGNRLCASPEHLALAPSNSGRVLNSYKRKKTHCVHGHEYTKENTMIANGHRACKQCHNRQSLEWYYRKKKQE